jgi:hypothetical protein
MNWRSKKLTQSAQHEACVSCTAFETVVWAHSNLQRHGKGKGIKAHDLFGAYLCAFCHGWFDGSSGFTPPSVEEYEAKPEWFMRMWERSMIVACKKGYL